MSTITGSLRLLAVGVAVLLYAGPATAADIVPAYFVGTWHIQARDGEAPHFRFFYRKENTFKLESVSIDALFSIQPDGTVIGEGVAHVNYAVFSFLGAGVGAGMAHGVMEDGVRRFDIRGTMDAEGSLRLKAEGDAFKFAYQIISVAIGTNVSVTRNEAKLPLDLPFADAAQTWVVLDASAPTLVYQRDKRMVNAKEDVTSASSISWKAEQIDFLPLDVQGFYDEIPESEGTDNARRNNRPNLNTLQAVANVIQDWLTIQSKVIDEIDRYVAANGGLSEQLTIKLLSAATEAGKILAPATDTEIIISLLIGPTTKALQTSTKAVRSLAASDPRTLGIPRNLTRVASGHWKSEGGLVYRMRHVGANVDDETRVAHLFQHFLPVAPHLTRKPVHTMFAAEWYDGIALIDDVWRQVTTQKLRGLFKGGRTEYLVDMGRVVGLGPQGEPLQHVVLVIEDSNRFVTAFPTSPELLRTMDRADLLTLPE